MEPEVRNSAVDWHWKTQYFEISADSYGVHQKQIDLNFAHGNVNSWNTIKTMGINKSSEETFTVLSQNGSMLRHYFIMEKYFDSMSSVAS